ncbi:pentatricopeptide repeat-containing protein At1g11290, chloroplastic [Cryptomeria japonica]|uniref:pentatricopeptide repeat-containing protein At1g11290, chloroplastic n=1 Tax=Cryptomeria japonica TaxID=3369 RepID=UPI0027DA4A9A|nr:pentatricopeptide repeat-containing protein At1g11290, chloroplastic [Cryptomeria japonica]
MTMHSIAVSNLRKQINGLEKQGDFKDALHITEAQIDYCSFVSLLQSCVHKKTLQQGKIIHAHIYKRGFTDRRLLWNTLINMYVKCANLADARKVFDKMPQRDVCSWTVVIAAYSRQGPAEEALKLFQKMQSTGVQPNQYTYASILLTCANMALLDQGVELHEQILRKGFEFDVVVATALIDMYAKCRSIEKAQQLFDKMPHRDVVTWNAMITGYAQNGLVNQALELFQKMPQRDVFSWTGMIAGLGQNGYADQAVKLFNQMPHKTIVSWNAMIAGFALNEHGDEALKLFDQMQSSGVQPNSNTFLSILSVCANLAALDQGMQMHGKIMTSKLQSDVSVVNAVIDMYAKCGSIQKAREVFDRMPQRNVVSWSALIGGYAMHGYAKEALKLFEEMKLNGTSPDHITFVNVLSACSRAGLVEEGCQCFTSMSENYNLVPKMEHYRCMVDLLGRAGRLEEARDFISEMPIKPDAIVWICLLSACRVHNNVELAESVAEHILKLEPTNPAPYVLLTNIYAAAGRWSDIAKARKMMKDRCLKKTPGRSWIVINKQVHAFFVGEGCPI